MKSSSKITQAVLAAGLGMLLFFALARHTAAQTGFLLVSGFDSGNVVQFDGTTGAFSGVFIPAGAGGLSQAEQLAFAPDGSLLVNSFGSNRVLRFDGQTGAFLNEFASIALPTGLVIHNGLAYVRATHLARSSTGTT